MNNWQLRRWLAREVLGQDIGRKPVNSVNLKFTRGPARNWKYRAWIRTLPCAVCGTLQYVEAAHTGPHAIGQKASDYACIPLCVEHHRGAGDSLHYLGRAEFEQRHGFTIGDLVRRLNSIWFQQWKVGNE